jgi:hypothetical protein
MIQFLTQAQTTHVEWVAGLVNAKNRNIKIYMRTQQDLEEEVSLSLLSFSKGYGWGLCESFVIFNKYLNILFFTFYIFNKNI